MKESTLRRRDGQASWAVAIGLYTAVTIALMYGSPLQLHAQISGTVMATSGQPVGGATVELWRGRELLMSRRSLVDGRFHLAHDGDVTGLALLVRAVGFSPELRSLDSAERFVDVRLAPLPMTMDPIVVRAGPTCPNRESVEARAAWNRAAIRNRHKEPLGLRSMDALTARLIVGASELGTFDNALLGLGELWVGGQLDRMLSISGYAWRASGGVSNPRFSYWNYPYLESGFAHHFVDSLFGSLHTLGLLDSLAGGDILLSFCPRAKDGNRIEGTMVIGGDGTLRKASWVFRTRDHDEGAGGVAVFPDSSPDDDWPVPVPVLGIFWRKRVFDYLEEVWEFRKWEAVPGKP